MPDGQLFSHVNACFSGVAIRAASPPVIGVNDWNPPPILLSSRSRRELPGLPIGSADGFLTSQFGDLFWFEHVHIFPRMHAMGLVVDSLGRNHTIYNGFRNQARSVIDINYIDFDGLSVTSGQEFPTFVIRQKKSVEYIVSVDRLGPPVIESSIEYVFDNGRELIITYTGSRVVLLFTVPEFEVKEELEWLTEVETSVSGVETRRSLWDVPQQRFIYRWIGDDAEKMNVLLNQIWDWQPSVWSLPIWTDYTVLTAPVGVAATAIQVEDTTNRDFRASVNGQSRILVYNTQFDWEVLESSSLGSTTVNLFNITAKAHDTGELVIQLLDAQIEGEVGQKLWRGGFQEIRAKFRILSTINITPPAYITYQSLPIMPFDLAVVGGNQYGDTIDAEIDVVKLGSQRTFGSTIKRHSSLNVTGVQWVAYTRQEAWALRTWLYALRGRYQAFWRRSERSEFTPKAAGPSLDFLVVELVYYARHVWDASAAERAPRDHVYVSYANGTTDLRAIIGAVEDFDNLEEVLQFDSVLSQPYTSIVRMGFLHRTRLDRDSVTITYRGHDNEMTVPVTLRDIVQ